jgi:hypothetical protein
LSAPEIRFLIKILEDVVETSELVIANIDNKKDHAVVVERRRRFVAKEMIRRFNGTLEGRKMHMRDMALILCKMVID